MSNEKYTIKPLEWRRLGSKMVADSPLGQYQTGPREFMAGSPFYWAFDRNGYRPCESIEEGMEICEENHRNRLIECLDPE